ncbi:MAG: alpha/beta fold hydrolase [Polyangiaceae bacterium]
MPPRLSLPVENHLAGPYDVIILGSGYGGSIAASRLARARRKAPHALPLRIALLERGKELQPGEYPETELEALAQLQTTREGKHEGSETGLFDFHLNEEINVLVGCGLGGTSLINANVSILPDPRVFSLDAWPREIRNDPAPLAGYTKRAHAMLQATPYPDAFPPLHKLEALEASAARIGAECFKPDINVTFEDGPNVAGVYQKKCTLCGDCVSGCNHWAKNTLIMNYLPDARQYGAEIYTEVAARRVERIPTGWRVYYEHQGVGREKFDGPDAFVDAAVVIVAAGTLGSTEILLRSKEHGLAVSDQLGKRFSGNGDVLAFGYDCNRSIDGVGYGRKPVPKGKEVGPCITGLIDLRKTARVQDGIIIEDGAIPGAIGAELPEVFGIAAAAIGHDTDRGVADLLGQKVRQLESQLGGPHVGAVRNAQTYLAMTHDEGTGVMSLESDRLRVDWPGAGEEPIFEKVDAKIKACTAALSGVHVRDPLWTKLLGDELVTVHPLGGCAMGDTAADGVVDHKGRVFSGSAGTDVHDGLYVCDGAVIPRPLGVNPLLTISTLAERCVHLLAQDRDWEIDYESGPRPVPDPGPATIGLEFTETMKGKIQVGEREEPCEFTVTIASQNLDDMLANAAHEAAISGTVTCPALSATPLTVRTGIFHLFTVNPAMPEARLMTYDMVLRSAEGEAFRFAGFKDVRRHAGTNVWIDTTTLFLTVSKGPGEKGPTVGTGTLTISPSDLARQLTTIRVLRAPDTKTRLEAALRFAEFFGKALFDVYGGIARPGTWGETGPRRKRPLRAPPPELHPLRTADGVDLLLTRYRGGPKGPVLLVHGAGVSSGIFSTDTIDTNLVEFLVARGYDVWLFDWRCSIALPASRDLSTGDAAARFDYPAAVAKILSVTRSADLQAVVHCYGSTTFFMSMLDPAGGLKGVRSIVASQIAIDYVVPPFTKLKAGLHVPGILDKLGVRSLTAYAGEHESWSQSLFDLLLHFEPLGVGEDCANKVCHRIAFLYGELYEHANLTDLNHERMHELFGLTNIKGFEQLAAIVRAKQLVNAAGENTYLKDEKSLERLALPIRFIHGADNRCYLPESTRLTYERLRRVNSPGLYSRVVIPDHGHIDCIFGRNASSTVFPFIAQHLDEAAAPG